VDIASSCVVKGGRLEGLKTRGDRMEREKETITGGSVLRKSDQVGGEAVSSIDQNRMEKVELRQRQRRRFNR